jgi:hypothetical protein
MPIRPGRSGNSKKLSVVTTRSPSASSQAGRTGREPVAMMSAFARTRVRPSAPSTSSTVGSTKRARPSISRSPAALRALPAALAAQGRPGAGAIQCQAVGAGDAEAPHFVACRPQATGVQRNLGRHAAHTRAGRAQRPVVDQYEIASCAPYLPQCIEAGGAGADDGDVGRNVLRHVARSDEMAGPARAQPLPVGAYSVLVEKYQSTVS